MKHAFAYALWLMCSINENEEGPSQSDEREFILIERNRVKFQQIHNSIKSLSFGKCLNDSDLEANTNYNYCLEDNTSSLLPLINKNKKEKTRKSEEIFKYGCCTICLSDFESGEKVKMVPQCKHTFHAECLEKWLLRKFSCPNCNLEIKIGS